MTLNKSKDKALRSVGYPHIVSQNNKQFSTFAIALATSQYKFRLFNLLQIISEKNKAYDSEKDSRVQASFLWNPDIDCWNLPLGK